MKRKVRCFLCRGKVRCRFHGAKERVGFKSVSGGLRYAKPYRTEKKDYEAVNRRMKRGRTHISGKRMGMLKEFIQET